MTKRTREEAGLEDDPMASDGSDYDSEGVEESEDDDDDMSYEEEAFFVEPAPLPPRFPPQATTSLEELRQLIEQHRQERTLFVFLTVIQDQGTMFEARYSDPEAVGAQRHLVSIAYCSILHCACMDRDGPRGEEKIRIILEAAKSARVDLAQILLAGQIHLEPDNGAWKMNAEKSDVTPLHILLDNPNSTIESFRMLCKAWPQVVLLNNPTSGTILMYLMAKIDSKLEWTIVRTKILLETAEKTKAGAKGLVSASDIVIKGMDTASFVHDTVNGGGTALHTATIYQRYPDQFIHLFLQAWPDALMYCRDVNDDSPPLHNIFFSDKCIATRSSESIMNSIEAFFRYSSLEGLAFALLCTNWRGVLGFYLVWKSCCIDPDYDSPDPFAYVAPAVHPLLRRKDRQGRSLLHYAAANNAEVNEIEFREIESDIIEDENLDPTDQEWEALQQERNKLEKRNRGHVVKLCKWILTIHPPTASELDFHGMNPFHYAISKGKQWDTGLEDLVKLVPGWPHSREAKTGLYPFMLAATPEYSQGANVDTIYELLRFDASILQGMIGDELNVND